MCKKFVCKIILFNTLVLNIPLKHFCCIIILVKIIFVCFPCIEIFLQWRKWITARSFMSFFDYIFICLGLLLLIFSCLWVLAKKFTLSQACMCVCVYSSGKILWGKALFVEVSLCTMMLCECVQEPVVVDFPAISIYHSYIVYSCCFGWG